VNLYPFIEAEKAQQRNVKRACELLEVPGPVAAGAAAVMVPGGAMELAAGAAPQGVVDRQYHRGVGRDQHRGDEVQQDQAELVSRPASGGKEPVGQVVVAPSGQPGADQHPGDGALPWLGQEPAHQRLEGPRGGRGEAGSKDGEQVGERAR
jgi:hypothetical protein